MATLRSLLTFACLLFAATRTISAQNQAEDVRVMTFNLWHGGDGGKQPFERTVEVVCAAKADVVGLQETAGYAPQGKERPDHAERLAKALGWHYLKQKPGYVGSNIGIISRYPIVAEVGEGHSGATIRLPSGREIDVFNAHLMYTPYQPYQLLKIPYHNAPFLTTADEAIASANAARKKQIDALLKAIGASKSRVRVVTGDFNEPSCLDWTPATVAGGTHPVSVEWPSTKSLSDAGFTDSYRKRHPDPVKSPGMTWATITKRDDPKDHHDRIDFVFVAGEAEIRNVEIVGEAKEQADIVAAPYPSDHRAVVTTLRLDK
ncbi:MAG: endonuclease/exonuclease/phosphatase family protein [Pirellulales bacterium]